MVVPAGDVDAFTEKIGELIRYVDQRMPVSYTHLDVYKRQVCTNRRRTMNGIHYNSSFRDSLSPGQIIPMRKMDAPGIP